MSEFIKLLPPYLIQRYKNWKITGYEKSKDWYKKLANEGQNPSAMVISCCDSRIHTTSIFGADLGEFFIHRNIANIVPPFNPNGDHHGTSAAVEYAIKTLKVLNIIVIGHSNCGGIHSGYNLFKGNLCLDNSIFVKKWLSILRPAFETVLLRNSEISDKAGIEMLEKESILTSINNLIEFPFIKDCLIKKDLNLHGLWHDIETGDIQFLDPNSLQFKKLD
jgi:carbonic anhydrase